MAYEFDEDTYERAARKRRHLSYLRRQRTAQREVEQSGVQDDPTFWQKALGTVGEVAGAPVVKTMLDMLGAPQKQLAGMGSLAAEGLSNLLPGENEYAKSGVGIGLTDILAAPMDFTGEGALAQRGAEFNEKVGRSMNVAGLGTTGPVQEFLADVSPGASLVEDMANEIDPRAGEFGGGGGIDDFTAQMGFEIATDPLNVLEAAGGLTKPIGAGYRALKQTSIGRQAVLKFPSLLLPEKAWLKLSGFSKKANLLGKSEKLNDLYVVQQAFEKDAGYQVEKFKQGVTAKYVKHLNSLKGLPEGEANRIKEAVPLVVEHTDAATRQSLIASAKKRGDDASRLLYEMADDYALDADAIKALENGALKLQTKDLADEVNYFGRRFTPEVEDLIAHHPEAREIIFAAKMNKGKDAIESGWLSWEKGRKLRGFDFKEAEETVRASLRKSGVPVTDDMAIFSRDAFGDITRRADKSLEAAKIRNLYQSFADTFGTKAPNSDGAWQVVSDAMTKGVDSAWARAAEAQTALDAAKAGQAGFREARPALRQAGSAQATEAKRIPKAAQEVADVVRGQRDLRASLKVEKDLRKMFPGAEGVADDAEDAMRGMADVIGKRLEANPRAKQLVARFYENYQKAIDVDGYRAAVRQFKDDLRTVVSPAIAKEYTKFADDAIKQLDRLAVAQQAVAKPVALAVNQRVRDAEKTLAAANDIAANSDVSKWSPEAQARFIQSALERVNAKPLDGASALDILIKAKAPLPKTPEELARLAMTVVSPKDAREFTRYAKAHYWQHIDAPGKFWKTMDAVKGIYQRAVLARPGSLAKDFQGTMINGVMSGNTPHLAAAFKELGTQKEWKQGGKISDLVARLRAEGVLRNVTTEIDETQGTFKRVAMQLREEGATKRAGLLERLAPIEERGMLGAPLGKKLGGKVSKVTDSIVEARAYTEEMNRVASYMKAIKDGATHEEAVEDVFKLWGNFSELTRLDKNVLSRMLFFWNWWAKSIPITVRHLLDRPVKSRLLLTMMAGNASDDETMPPWLQRMGGVIMGKDDAGNATVLNMGSGSYFSPTMSVLQGEMAKNLAAGNVAEAARGGAFDLARSAPPYISEPVGAVFGRDMFTGKRWWEDEANKVGSQVRAPMALRWFVDTPVGDAMNLKPYEPDGDLKYITMDPKWATLIGMTPGMEPVLSDISASTDPRSKDLGEFSLRKGLVRQAGLPLYSVPVDDKALQNAKDGQRALRQTIDKNAHALGMRGDYVYADTSNKRGAKLKTAWEMYETRARSYGFKKGSPQFKRYVASQLKRDWPAEYEYIDIGEKLRFLRQLNEKGEVRPLDGMNLKPR